MCKKSIQIILANDVELRHNLNNVKVSHIHVQTFSLVLIQSRTKHIMLCTTHISEFVLHEEVCEI